MHSRILFALSIILLLLANCSKAKAFTEIEAKASIAAAEQSLVSAYDAVLEAEKGGANVTSLTAQLNVAAANLTLAYNRLQQLDCNGTVALAEGCRQAADNVVTQASVLRDVASAAVPLALWTSVLAWVCSIGMIVSVTVFSWRVFKRRYYRRILTMKLEVVADESQ
jgi:hypothetical protein